jgi:tRNA(Ile)-lysidine synthase
MNEQEVLARVRAAGLLSEGREVVVLLSGGRDSTCLLDLSARIAGPDAVRALHVNYGLRGPASDDDERHCAALCARLGVALTVRRPGPARARGNLQAWAREVRYREAGELAGPRGADVAHAADLADAADVAAGHTATDQVETILYRLASSPSRRALLGMRPREALAGGGRLVRPLLGITRADTAAYCESRGLTWREDESNASDAYARNRVRSGLLAALSEVHPGALGNVLAVAEVLRDEAEVLDALVDDAVGDGEAVTLEALRGLPAALRRLVVQRMADEASGGLAPGAARRADDVAAMAERGTAMLDIGGGLRAVAEYGRVHIERLDARGAVAQAQVVLAIPGCASFGGIEVRCEVTAPVPEPGVLDRGALGRSELVVRTWRAGDRIAPLGLGGATKSLQDLFTGRRVPRLKRSTVPVVECGGEIVWVAGVATSERFKVTASTREAVRLSCS